MATISQTSDRYLLSFSSMRPGIFTLLSTDGRTALQGLLSRCSFVRSAADDRGFLRRGRGPSLKISRQNSRISKVPSKGVRPGKGWLEKSADPAGSAEAER
jgi:hypothetical protein